MNFEDDPQQRVPESQSLNDMAGRGKNLKTLMIIGIGPAPEKKEDLISPPKPEWYEEYRKTHKPFSYIEDEIRRA